jgi:hypothetical protein
MLKMDIKDVYKTVDTLLSRKTNDMTKIKIKCWVYHSKSRLKNGNEPFEFNDYIHGLGKDFYLEYIDFGFIDCDDLGGKDKAIEVVKKWFG